MINIFSIWQNFTTRYISKNIVHKNKKAHNNKLARFIITNKNSIIKSSPETFPPLWRTWRPWTACTSRCSCRACLSSPRSPPPAASWSSRSAPVSPQVRESPFAKIKFPWVGEACRVGPCPPPKLKRWSPGWTSTPPVWKNYGKNKLGVTIIMLQNFLQSRIYWKKCLERLNNGMTQN